MNRELLSDMFFAAPELWYAVLLVFGLLAWLAASNYVRLLKLKRKNYFVRRDRERYAETLYASKDGYFAFIYPDDRVDDAAFAVSERCSRRLAVLLGLPAGTDTPFDGVLKGFYKEDADKILKYTALLREDGVSFEDRFELKNGKKMILNGVRISGSDGSVYSDIIWFRDISYIAAQIDGLQKEKQLSDRRADDLKDLVDNLPCPVWMRTPQLSLKIVNKKYLEFCGGKYNEVSESGDFEIAGAETRELAQSAQDSNKMRKKYVHLNQNGEHRCFEVTETPFHVEQSLDKIATVGMMTDVSSLDNLRRNLKQNQNMHLEILASLGTAIAVFDSSCKLIFCNRAFVRLWELDENWLEEHSAYGAFLDYLREKRLLPEVPDYPHYRNEEHKMFTAIMEPKEDLLHLPDGRSLRRIRAPHLKGGLIFAFEDITDRLTARREYNALFSVQQEILNNIEEAVLIFGPDGRLQFYNQAYVNMWDADEVMLQKEPSFTEILETQKVFFSRVSNWEELKKDILNHIFSSATRAFSLNRSDNLRIECFSSLLSNESIMVLMHKTASV